MVAVAQDSLGSLSTNEWSFDFIVEKVVHDVCCLSCVAMVLQPNVGPQSALRVDRIVCGSP